MKKILVITVICILFVTGCKKDGESVPGPFAGISVLDTAGDMVIEGSLEDDSAMFSPQRSPEQVRKQADPLIGKELILLDSEGNILANRIVNENDKQADGSYYYMFRGDFSNKTLKMKVPYNNESYELLLGDYPAVLAEETNKKHFKLEKLSIKKEVISTKICEEREKIEPGFAQFDIRDRHIMESLNQYTHNHLRGSINELIKKLEQIKVNPYFPDEVYLSDVSHTDDSSAETFSGKDFTDLSDMPLIAMDKFPVKNDFIREIYAGNGTAELQLIFTPGQPLPIRYKGTNPMTIKVVYDNSITPSSYLSFSGRIFYSSAADYVSFEGSDIETAVNEDEHSVTLTFKKDFRPASTGKMMLFNSGAGTKTLPDGTVVSHKYFPLPPFEIY